MAQPPSIHIVACGAVTSVGASTPVGMAAAQAGLSRMMLVPEGAAEANPDGEATNIARIATLTEEDPALRGASLLRLALEQVLSVLDRRDPGPLEVCLVGPPILDGTELATKLITKHLRQVPSSVLSVGAHGAASLHAVERALAALAAGSANVVLVAGFDVRTHEEAVEAAVAAGRAIGPGRSFGQVLGEAGAALLLANARGLQRLGLRSLATLVGVATGREPCPMGAATPCLGRGLTEVIKRVLAPLPAHTSITQVFCDLNGERHRSDEWGFTVPRIAGRLKDPGMLSAPSVVWGDCGAVNGLLLLALAAAAGQRDGVAAAHALVWTSSDGAERAAAVLRAEPPTAVAAPAPAGGMPAAQLPSWAAELDDSMLLEMVDECDFRLEQRAFQLCRLCGDNPPADFDPVARAEDFLEALVLGLVECGTRAIDAAKQAIEPEAPGTTYAAVRALLEGGQVRPAIELAKELLLSDPSSEVAIAQAFLHARAPAIGQTGVAALLEAPAPFFLLGLQVAAAAGMEVPTPTLLKLAQGLPSERQVEFLNACGRVGGPDFRSYLAPWEGSPDPAVRREAALADVLIGKAACRERLLAKAGADAALLLPAALLVDDRRAGWLSALARAKPGADAVLAAGLAGEAGATAFLLDRMVDPAEAGAAAAALEILLGVSCFEEQETPDEDPSAPPQIVRRLSYARAAWEQAARQALTPPPPPVRLRCGKPGTAATTVELLRRPHLPLVARQYLGYELAARWGGSRAFDASAPVRAQRSYLSRLDPPPA